MRIIIIMSILFLSNIFGKNVNDYISDETISLDNAPSVLTSEMSLKGIDDNIPKTRTQESVVTEVQDNQSKLKNIYKKWAMKEDVDGISKIFGMSLTIDNNGDVVKVIVKGIPNKDFAKEVQDNVKGWSFSKVKEAGLKTFSFRNLDFTFRKEIDFSNP